jgi:DNA sulfur modification protein DndD
MKLIKATFKNFRLLKDLELDFSDSNEKKLTVIRAANETGKTTCLYGLMWGLFGSQKVLRKDYILSPKNSITSDTKSLDISVEIEFTQTTYSNTKGGVEKEEGKYRLKRSCTEIWRNKNFEDRTKDQISLFKITPNGVKKESELVAYEILNDALPTALKDVYFTDGDSALAFIEALAGQYNKRRRVSDAIESLLGLETIRQATKHMNVVATKFGSEVDNTDYQDEYEKLSNNILSYEEDMEEAKEELIEANSAVESAIKELRINRTKIDELLSLGDKLKLLNSLKQEESNLIRTEINQQEAIKNLAKLVSQNEYLSQFMLSKHATTGISILNKLSEKNQLPKLNIPILEELLEKNECFCHEDLSPGTEKRKIIEKSIKDSVESDTIQDAATTLYFSIRSKKFNESSKVWLDEYSSLTQSYFNLSSMAKEHKASIESINIDISKIDDSNLQQYRELENSLGNAKQKATDRISELNFTIHDRTERKNTAEIARKSLETKIGKVSNVGSYIALSRKTKDIFENIIDKLKKEELKKVSDQLNKTFLDMIGSSPEKNDLTVITRAELTEDYDIVVYGPNGNKLDPDQDLNGASRRAITLAFILALTKVSEVEAPNVIDTPLGMMSGFVKQSVLENTIREGSQTILFLTHDEINGVESIIDKYAGKVFTLTNPAHYPQMLVNKPNVTDARIVRCECDHRHTCTICERKTQDA